MSASNTMWIEALRQSTPISLGIRNTNTNFLSCASLSLFNLFAFEGRHCISFLIGRSLCLFVCPQDSSPPRPALTSPSNETHTPSHLVNLPSHPLFESLLSASIKLLPPPSTLRLSHQTPHTNPPCQKHPHTGYYHLYTAAVYATEYIHARTTPHHSPPPPPVADHQNKFPRLHPHPLRWRHLVQACSPHSNQQRP